jgi:hypothetical protein
VTRLRIGGEPTTASNAGAASRTQSATAPTGAPPSPPKALFETPRFVR